MKSFQENIEICLEVVSQGGIRKPFTAGNKNRSNLKLFVFKKSKKLKN